jgi:hypothetical protein
LLKKASSPRRSSVAKQAAPKWKIVDDKVFMSGCYTLADMKAALKALENATER